MPTTRKPIVEPGGLTTIVGGIIAYLPRTQISAPSGAWHNAFMHLRDKYRNELPELGELEFSRRAGVQPISERLEQIFQILAMSGTTRTLNPTLITRQFDQDQKQRLRQRLAPRLGARTPIVRKLGKELNGLLKHAQTS